MREFSLEQIEATRSFFETKGFLKERVQIGGQEVFYWVIPQGLNPQLPDFAMRQTPANATEGEVSGVFGVSDSVPEELRPYWAAHEIIEFTKIGIDQSGRCRLAEEQVVDLVPPGLRESFIDRRVEFFTNLVDYFNEDLAAGTGNYTQEDLKEVKTSLDYLKQLQPQKPKL